MRIEGSPMIIVPFWRRTPWTGADKPNGTYLPKDKPLCSYMIGWKYVGYMGIPTMIGWTQRLNLKHYLDP
jgi:hypothetical protein